MNTLYIYKSYSKNTVHSIFLVIFFIVGSMFGQPGVNNWKNIAPNLTLGGSVRVRGEVKNTFDFKDSYQDYFLTQVRLNFRWEPADFLSLFVEGQDSRVFGEEINSVPGINKDARPNVFQDNFDLHQAYLTVNLNSIQTPLKVKIGRQKFNFGAMRLVASLEWVNTARVWDGVRISFGNPKERIIELFGSRVVPVTPNSFNDYSKTKSRYFNSGFWGAYYKDKQLIPNSQLEAYWLYRRENSAGDDVHTYGSRVAYKYKKFDFNSEFALQFGDFSGLDHNAYMFHVEAGYSFMLVNKSRLGVTYNFGSGDDNPSDQKHKTFDNLYPLNHAYYGYMDLFSLQNINNTEVTFTTNIFGNVGLRIAWHKFWLADADNDAWYNAGLAPVRRGNVGSLDSEVGDEFDVTFKYPLLNKKLVIIGGYSRFIAGSYVEQTGNSIDPNFFFLMSKLSF